jgi:hypothetical protein
MTKSIGRAKNRSLRSLTQIYGSMKGIKSRTEAQQHDKTVENAFVETAVYLSGFSNHSAFRTKYDDDTLKELSNMQSKFETEVATVSIRRRRNHRAGIES